MVSLAVAGVLLFCFAIGGASRFVRERDPDEQSAIAMSTVATLPGLLGAAGTLARGPEGMSLHAGTQLDVVLFVFGVTFAFPWLLLTYAVVPWWKAGGRFEALRLANVVGWLVSLASWLELAART